MKEILDDDLFPEEEKPSGPDLGRILNLLLGLQLAYLPVFSMTAWITMEGSILLNAVICLFGTCISGVSLWLREREGIVFGITHTSISLIGVIASVLAGWWEPRNTQIPLYFPVSLGITIYGIATFFAGVRLRIQRNKN